MRRRERKSRIAALTAVLGALSILIAVERIRAYTLSPTINWMIPEGGLAILQQLDRALVRPYFDHPNANILGGSEPAVKGVPTRSFTALGPCGDPKCRSFESDLKAGAVGASRTPVLLYDNEDWPKTPKVEQKNPCEYMSDFTSLAHSHHFLTIMAPDQNLMQPRDIIQKSYPGNETENWQSYIRYSMAACAAQSGTDRYHIMSQPFESFWCCNPAHNAQGSESDFINFVQQAALQARAVNPKIAMTMGLSTNPKYRPTPLILYQDSLDVQSIVDGIWMNVGSQFRPPMAIQYYELTSGLVPFYLQSEGRLSSAYPAGATKAFSLGAANASLNSISEQTFAAGTVIPAGPYKFEPFTDGTAGSAVAAVEFGYCEAPKCAHRIPVISGQAAIPSGDPGVTTTLMTSSSTTLPAGGPYSLYFVLRVTSPGDFNLNYNSGTHSANIAIPRPSTLPAPKPNASVFFAHNQGKMGTHLPTASTPTTFNLGAAGAARTFVSGKTYPAETVIPADAYGFQYWTDGTSGSAVLNLQFGYCLAPHCTGQKPIISANQNWTPTITAGAKGAANPYGAFTTRDSTTLPPGGPYNLYWTATVKTPAPLDLLYGSASAPTNLATPFVQPR